VPDADRLRRLALAAVRRAEHAHRSGVADPCEAAPELRADAAVVRILDDVPELAALDDAPALAAELEFVARVVDRPGRVGFHQHAMLDGADELVERALARFEIEIRHPVDRRSVPPIGARIGDSRQSCARLGNGAAERPLEDAVPDQVRPLGARAFVVERIAREFLGTSRIERDVQELGAVPVGAEHVQGDEARAREVALVAEDAVELERMPDRFVDLEHHLVGREQHVHPPGRAVRCDQQFERLPGDAGARAAEAESVQDFGAALLADAAVAVQRAALCHAVIMGGDGERRIQEAITLDDVAAFARDQAVGRMPHVDQRFPIDDARVAARVLRFALQQLVPFPA
jgi:hypothetical protein